MDSSRRTRSSVLSPTKVIDFGREKDIIPEIRKALTHREDDEKRNLNKMVTMFNNIKKLYKNGRQINRT